MEPLNIAFDLNNLGRVDFVTYVMTGDSKSFGVVEFKLDSGSDFTTVNYGALLRLGYTKDFLENCPYHPTGASTASNDIRLQYINNVSIKFKEREIQGCRIFFARNSKLRSLFGSDILKYFNWSVNYDEGILQLAQTKNSPILTEGEPLLHIYNVERN